MNLTIIYDGREPIELTEEYDSFKVHYYPRTGDFWVEEL